MTSAPTPARGRLVRWLLHPRSRFAAQALLLLGFAVGVGLYMSVVNRYVHFSVQVDAPTQAEPGGQVPTRVHVYRPERRDPLRGQAAWTDAAGRPLTDSAVVTGVAVPFSLPVPPEGEGEARFSLTVRVDDEVEARHAELTVPVRPLATGGGIAALPAAGSERLVRPQAASERARIHRLRSAPSDADVAITLVAESGFPVRFLENRLYVRLTRDDGTPLVDHDGVARVMDEGEVVERRFRTDRFGLAEVTATPLDIETWEVETAALDGRVVTAQFEVVPGFDGVIARPERSVVAVDEPFAVSVVTALGADRRWYYDVRSGGYWLATGFGSELGGRHVLPPPAGRWHAAADRLRFATLQVYTSPFLAAPQNSVRGLLFRPADVTEREAVDALLATLAQRDLDGTWLRALRAAGEPGAETPFEELERLASFVLVRLLPTFVPATSAYDDTASQTAALLADTSRFRGRMHWILGVGVLGLMSGIVGRIVVYTVRTRRRTRLLLAELSDDETTLSDDTALAEMRSAVVPLALAAVTISAFFVGVIFMLANM